MNVTDAKRSEIVAHYRTHESTYQRIWGQLETVRENFAAADTDGKIAYLKLSYINSVISVQTPLHIHEEAFRLILDGADLETALERVNYNRQKLKYIKQCLNDSDLWETLVSDLETDGIDAAHKTGIDRLKFVGTVKVPFTFANLGFTSKMCIDANVVRVMGIDEIPTTVVVDRYEAMCESIRDEFPTLTDEIDPYHLQWVLFDYQRFNRTGMSDASAARHNTDQQVAYHEAWFDGALKDVSDIKQVVADLG